MKHPPRNITISCFKWEKIILQHTDMPSNAKFLALYLGSHMNINHDMAWPSYRTMAREMGISTTTAEKWVSFLVDEGWIIKQSGSRVASNQYWIGIPNEVSHSLGYPNEQEKVSQPVGHNNNTNNNTLSRGFKRPSIQDVTDYCADMNYIIDPETFVNYYNSNGWVVGRASMKCWKSACTNWNTREKKNGRNRTKPQKDTIETFSISGNTGHDYIG